MDYSSVLNHVSDDHNLFPIGPTQRIGERLEKGNYISRLACESLNILRKELSGDVDVGLVCLTFC